MPAVLISENGWNNWSGAGQNQSYGPYVIGAKAIVPIRSPSAGIIMAESTDNGGTWSEVNLTSTGSPDQPPSDSAGYAVCQDGDLLIIATLISLDADNNELTLYAYDPDSGSCTLIDSVVLPGPTEATVAVAITGLWCRGANDYVVLFARVVDHPTNNNFLYYAIEYDGSWSAEVNLSTNYGTPNTGGPLWSYSCLDEDGTIHHMANWLDDSSAFHAYYQELTPSNTLGTFDDDASGSFYGQPVIFGGALYIPLWKAFSGPGPEFQQVRKFGDADFAIDPDDVASAHPGVATVIGLRLVIAFPAADSDANADNAIRISSSLDGVAWACKYIANGDVSPSQPNTVYMATAGQINGPYTIFGGLAPIPVGGEFGLRFSFEVALRNRFQKRR